MANLQEQATWESGVYQIETTDPVVGGPDGVSNVQAKQLGNRTAYLKQKLEEAQQSLDAVGVEGQNALWAAVELALADVGLLTRELDRNQTVRHQEGFFTLYNRGVKSGCSISKSTSASRNLSISSGVCFMHGAEMGVDSEENAASVPGNSGSSSATAQAYLYVLNNRVRLAVTGPNEEAPADTLVLADLHIPAGNTGATDQYLTNVTITTVARVEPDWPHVQTDPAYRQHDFEKVMHNAGYQLSLDIVGFIGGQKPVLINRDADRAANTFRVYGSGSADAVRVRFVAHLMNQ
ncbi:hypothetical protein [Vibrio injensis]|uniref:hypothetical protein n=1 Tax=Vibrio injensis TaxID=1307414 RepID=UPI000932761F|nr:hypothetical protein [Vibrio injensis]